MKPTKTHNIYFKIMCVFNTGYFIDFKSSEEEENYKQKFLRFLNGGEYKNQWTSRGVSFEFPENLGAMTPPLANSFVTIIKDEETFEKKVKIVFDNFGEIEVIIRNMKVDFYLFNTGIITFNVEIPKQLWFDLNILKELRALFQSPRLSIGNMSEDLYLIIEKEIKNNLAQFTAACISLNPSQIETPYLATNGNRNKSNSNIIWSHSILIVITSSLNEAIDFYKKVLLGTNPEGICNFSTIKKVFAFVEYGDSLFCFESEVHSLLETEQLFNKNWMPLLLMQEYLWKILWQINLRFHQITRVVVYNLRNEEKSLFKDVGKLSSLTNQIILMVDSLAPQNVSFVQSSIHFLAKVNESWETNLIKDSVFNKMQRLRELISQVDEIERKKRLKKLDLFLASVSIFALGSLVLDYIAAMSFKNQIGDISITSIVFTFIFIFLFIMYLLFRKN